MINAVFGWRSGKPSEAPPSKSKRWTTAQDGLDKIQLEKIDTPKPRDGEVLVRVQAVSLNERDAEVCMGVYNQQPKTVGPSPALVPCSDMCGTVVESKSDQLKIGTRVASTLHPTWQAGRLRPHHREMELGLFLPGVLSEYRSFPADSLVKVPDYLTDEEASCLPVSCVTAWMALNGSRIVGSPAVKSDAKSGENDTREGKETVLIHGTDGVSLSALQLAKAAGRNTILTASSKDYLDRAHDDLGATNIINARTHWEWSSIVLEMTSGQGVDLIVDAGGDAKTLRKGFDCLALGGEIACIGYPALAGVAGSGPGGGVGGGGGGSGGGGGVEDPGKSSEVNRLNVAQLAVRGNATINGVFNGPKDRFEEMLEFFKKEEIRPVVEKVFQFGEAKDAFALQHKGGIFGKVVIKVN